MSNSANLKRVFAQVQEQLNSNNYRWIGKDNCPEDYFDWALSYNTTADSIINSMIEEGDLETV